MALDRRRLRKLLPSRRGSPPAAAATPTTAGAVPTTSPLPGRPGSPGRARRRRLPSHVPGDTTIDGADARSSASPDRRRVASLDRASVLARLRASAVPGAAIAVIGEGEIQSAAGFGTVRAGRRTPVDAATVFQAASVSKPITALAVIGLADQGLLDLDADVTPLLALPLTAHPILGRSRRPRTVTARQLLTHQGGIIGRGTTPRSDGRGFLGPDRGGGSARFVQPRRRVPTLEESWRGSDGGRPVQLTYEPGSRTSYSGAGYLVLQHVVEQVTARPFATYLDEFMGRLGARRATFALVPPRDWPLASGHTERGAALPGGFELVPWSAAGGLFVDVVSLATMLASALDDRNGVLSAGALTAYRKGLGTETGRTPTGEATFGHGGDNGGFRASILGVPARRAGVVVLTNGRSSDGTKLRRELATAALRALG